MYQCTLVVVLRGTLQSQEPRPRPSGIGKDPRPFTSNPRNPPFTFPHPTLLSLGPAASPPLSRFLSACRSLFGALPSGSTPTTALGHPAKPQNPPVRVICDISPRPQSCSFCPDHPETRRLETPTHPHASPPSRTTFRSAPPCHFVGVCSGCPSWDFWTYILPHPPFSHPTSAASHKPTWTRKAHLQPGTLKQFLHTLGHRRLSCNSQSAAALDRLPTAHPVSS